MIHKEFLYGADYNPEQWLHQPDILKEDIELMKKANVNVVCMGMFSWSFLEKADGEYDFTYFIDIIDNLYNNGIYTIIGTPSGARPRWLTEKYPSVLRVNSSRERALYGERQNHCFTTSDYRKKTYDINYRLAQALNNHKGVILWHISNEFGGECHCELCQEAFREFVKREYKTVEELNQAWCMAFWSHIYTDFNQVVTPSKNGDSSVNGHNLDYQRFVTHQTIDFMLNEIKAIKDAGSTLPITTNMMHYEYSQNYFKYKEYLDVISWDSYPKWHEDKDYDMALNHGMFHDLMRSIKKEPFLLMESTPSMTNWQPISRQKRPKMNILSSLFALAHGSDSVQYFQWRQSRGASEKFHGACVNHTRSEESRVFQDVANLGKILKDVKEICGSKTKADVAIIFDWENMWALEGSRGPRNAGIRYKEQLFAHYKALMQLGVNIDVIDMECDISDYKLVVAPYLYMIRAEFDKKLEEFVAAGGALITGAFSGVVDRNDLCYLERIPHGLHQVLGIESLEVDSLYDHQNVKAKEVFGNSMNFRGEVLCTELCEVVACKTAETIIEYEEEYYKNRPVLSKNNYKKGYGYYLTSTLDCETYTKLYKNITQEHGIPSFLPFNLPVEIHGTQRTSGDVKYLFLMNFSQESIYLALDQIKAEGYTLLYGDDKDNRIKDLEVLIYKQE
ncbi:MAG: beta-galactosidase [Eubacteriales bacterium]